MTVVVALIAGVGVGLRVGALAGAGAAVLAVVLGLVGEQVVHRRFSAWGYVEREDDLLVRRGVCSHGSRLCRMGACSSST